MGFFRQNISHGLRMNSIRGIGHGPKLLRLNTAQQLCGQLARNAHVIRLRRRYKKVRLSSIACMPSNEDWTRQQKPGKAVSVLAYINESTKWVVSGIAFTVLIGKRDEMTAWCIIGGVISAMLCRTLKFLINASRPPRARKSDPGMPSSHACTLAFLSMYPSMMILELSPGAELATTNMVAALGLIAGGMFLTSLRVILGYHTWPQVIVGWLLGSSVAVSWQYIGVKAALPYLMSHAVGRWCLTLGTCGFVALFAVKNVLRWAREER